MEQETRNQASGTARAKRSWGSRRRQLLSSEEEKAFLKPWTHTAESFGVLVVPPIKVTFDEKLVRSRSCFDSLLTIGSTWLVPGISRYLLSKTSCCGAGWFKKLRRKSGHRLTRHRHGANSMWTQPSGTFFYPASMVDPVAFDIRNILVAIWNKWRFFFGCVEHHHPGQDNPGVRHVAGGMVFV